MLVCCSGGRGLVGVGCWLLGDFCFHFGLWVACLLCWVSLCSGGGLGWIGFSVGQDHLKTLRVQLEEKRHLATKQLVMTLGKVCMFFKDLGLVLIIVEEFGLFLG